MNATVLGRQIIINDAVSPAALVQVVTVAAVAAGAVVIREADPDQDPVNRRMIVDEGRNTSIGTGTRGSTAVAAAAATEIERRNTTNIVREKVINIVADGITRTKKIVIGVLAESIEKVIR